MAKLTEPLVFKRISRLMFICVLGIVLTTSGCQSLKKKFTRVKKNAQKEDAFVPVLQPEEYTAPAESPQDVYKYHYSLWQVYEKEFLTAVIEKKGDKRQEYLLNQLMMQSQMMEKMFTDQAKVAGLSQINNDLQKVLAELSSPQAMRNDFQMRKKVEVSGRKLREEYKPALVQDLLVPSL